MTVLLWTLIVGIHSYVFCYGKVFFVHDVFSYIYDEVQFLIFAPADHVTLPRQLLAMKRLLARL